MDLSSSQGIFTALLQGLACAEQKGVGRCTLQRPLRSSTEAVTDLPLIFWREILVYCDASDYIKYNIPTKKAATTRLLILQYTDIDQKAQWGRMIKIQ